MHYYIRLDQGDYLELRGGHDWGRTCRCFATRFADRREAHRWARRVRGTVCKEV